MASEGPGRGPGGDAEATQAFPNPPIILFSQYTDENVAAGVAPKPPKPVKGKYEMFGAPFNTDDSMIRPLEDQGITKLYPYEYDKKSELKKLNRSILICFLELLDILINNPSSTERNQKINDLTVLFINMHHLINEYRPHQARETLKVIMERQMKQREEMIQTVNRAMEKTHTILKSCDSLLSVTVSNLPPAGIMPDSKEDTTEGREQKMEDNNSMEVDVANKDKSNEQFSLVDSQDLQLTELVQSFLISSHQ